jgi:hypothetical protein
MKQEENWHSNETDFMPQQENRITEFSLACQKISKKSKKNQ